MASNKCETLTEWAVVPGTCTIIYVDEEKVGHPIDIWNDTNLKDKVLACLPEAAEASTFAYDNVNHIVTHNGVPWQLNCGVFNFNTATCELSYRDEKGNYVSYFIPQDRFIYNEDACSLMIIPAKGESAISIPLGVPAADVGLELVDNKVLEFTYKQKKCQVLLPNAMVGCAFDVATNTLRFLFCDGSEEAKALPKASLQCNTLDDGTQVLVFDNGCPGGQKMFNIPALVLDIDDLTIVGSVFTWTYGGDGNPNMVTVDMCDIIATHCNATFTQINPDGSFSFIDNAGTTFNVAPHGCCTFHNTAGIYDPATVGTTAYPKTDAFDGDTLIEKYLANDQGVAAIAYYTCVGGQWVLDFACTIREGCCTFHDIGLPYDPAGPNDPPAGKIAQALDGDTLTVKYPQNEQGTGALGYYTCVNGQWVLDFICPLGSAPPEVHIGTGAPDKADGFTVWFNPETCVLQLCDGADGWLEPRGVICSADTPPCFKGGPSFWFDVSTGCLHVQCIDDAGTCLWISSTGSVVNQVIQSLCVQTGNQAPVPLAVGEDGKVVIPLPVIPEIPTPDPGCCHYNTESTQDLEQGVATVPPSGTATKNVGDTALQKHPNGLSAWTCTTTGWALAWDCPFPVIPEFPEFPTFEYVDGDAAPIALVPDANNVVSIPHTPSDPPPSLCYSIGGAAPVDLNPNAAGKIQIPIPAPTQVPDFPTFCYSIGGATPVDLNPNAAGKIQIPIPAPPTVPQVPTFCYAVGDKAAVDLDPDADNKIQIPIPAFCYSIDGATPIDLEPDEDNKIEVPIPAPTEVPAFCYSIGGAAPVDLEPDADNKIQVPIPAPTEVPAFCYSIGEASPVDLEPDANNKIEIPIPPPQPILICDADQPATDGTAGLFWFDEDSGCLHVLCDGVWVSANASVSQP